MVIRACGYLPLFRAHCLGDKSPWGSRTPQPLGSTCGEVALVQVNSWSLPPWNILHLASEKLVFFYLTDHAFSISHVGSVHDLWTWEWPRTQSSNPLCSLSGWSHPLPRLWILSITLIISNSQLCISSLTPLNPRLISTRPSTSPFACLMGISNITNVKRKILDYPYKSLPLLFCPVPGKCNSILPDSSAKTSPLFFTSYIQTLSNACCFHLSNLFSVWPLLTTLTIQATIFWTPGLPWSS